MALTQVSTGGIKDGQISASDLADGAISAAKFDATALDQTYTLGASGTDHYTFTGEGLTGAVNDPTLYLTRGKTYRFVNGNSSGAHPFRIQSVAGAGGTEYNTGVTNNAGAGGSTIIFEVPHDAPDVLYYICTAHASMNGIFYVTGALADGSVTTAKLADDAVTDAKLANSINSAIAANTAKDLTALNATNLTSGQVPNARISQASVVQYVSPFDDDKIVNDISALALKINGIQNATRYNTNSTSVETFQDSNGVASFTNTARDSTGEYVSSLTQSYGTDQYWYSTDLDANRVTDHFNNSFSGAGLIDGGTSSFASYRNDPNNFDTGVGYEVGADSDFGAGFKITGFRFFNFQTQSRYKKFKFVVNNNQVDSSPETNSSRDGSSTYIMVSDNTQDYISATLDTPIVAGATTEIKVLFDEHYENVAGNPNCGIAEIGLKGQKLTTSVSATGSFISNVVTAPSSTTSMGVVITYKDQAGTATLNTDLKVSLSADNGSNFTQVTLVAQPDFATGIKMAAANDVTVTAGTQLKYKVEFANQASGSKETRVTGISMQY